MKLNGKKAVVGIAFGFIAGNMIGVWSREALDIAISNRIDLSTVISILSLVVAIFVMPFLIEDKKNKEKKVSEIAAKDLEDVSEKIMALRAMYEKQSTVKTKFGDKKKKEIVNQCRAISNMLYFLSDVFVSHKILPRFKEDIIAGSYDGAYRACTERLMTNEGLSHDELRIALEKIDKLFVDLKKKRYELYS